jgi:PAS domain S-box-containing protein
MPTSDLGAEAWESLFWSLFERSTNPVALVDEQRVVIEANGAMCQLLGVPHDELVGTKSDDSWPGTRPGSMPNGASCGKSAGSTASAP